MTIKRNHIAGEEPIRMAQSPDVYLVPCKNGPECGLPKPPEELLRGTKTVILWVDQPVEEQELRSALDTAGEDGAVVVNCPAAHLETVRAAIPPALRRWQRRRKIRARNDLSPEERAELSTRAVERLAESDLFRSAQTVMIYDHVRGELSLDSLLTHPASAGKRFCYPLCVSDTEMIAMVPGAWRPGAFGIREPVRELSLEIPPEEIDLVVCPGTAFDPACNRMGMGGGYYDRYLPRCVRAHVVMVAFEVQKVPVLPVDLWDQPVEAVFTEARVYRRDEPYAAETDVFPEQKA